MCSCTRTSYHWSSTTYRDSPNSAWHVHFYYGNVGGSTKSDNLYVRAVREDS